MKNSILAVFSAVVISAVTIGGVAYARGVDDSFKAKQQIAVTNTSDNTNPVVDNGNITRKDDGQASSNTTAIKSAVKIKDTVQANSNICNANYNENSANSSSKDIYKDMTDIMRDNGFKDAARYMQTGDLDAMNDYMNTLSQEDYDKMIEIMNSNGYGDMAQMMESIGRKGMVEMHNSMGSMPGSRTNGKSYNNMMGGSLIK